MTQEKEINAAADVFETVFRDILDAHACIKVFNENIFYPILSENTKENHV